ncbi:hypothetical protein KQX54_003152, partial [Cotesia glomerata]
MQKEGFIIPVEKITKSLVQKLESKGVLTNLNANFKMTHLPLMSPTLLEIAIWNWDEELFNYLISRKVSLEGTTNGTVLHLAVHRCGTNGTNGTNLNIARTLIALGVPINRRECLLHWTPLHLACYQGKLKMAELLIESGANVDISNIYNINNPEKNLGKQPLHVAVEANQVALVELLCRNGANVNAHALEHGTPLVHAVRLGKIEIVKVLIQGGADVNFLSKQCRIETDLLNYLPVKVFHLTALHLAVVKYQPRILKILLFHPMTNLNLVINNLTPLHFAVKCDFEALKLLLSAGADINVRTSNYRNIIEFCFDTWAKEGDTEKRERVCKLVIEHAAKLNVAGRYVLPEIAERSCSEFLELCRLELERMKNIKICGGTLTVDKIFGCTHKLAMILDNNDFKFLMGEEVRNSFEIYGEVLQWRAVKMYSRKKLLIGNNFDAVLNFLFEIVFQRLIPKKFVEKVLPFLSYCDLVEILKT